MGSPLQDERISAFLDGELPPDERAEFERQIADSAELRQLVEELRAVRDSLQALPRHKLEDDFAARVLQRAERTVLTSPAAVSPPAYSLQPTASAPRRSLRPYIWAAITIAAALVIMFFNPHQPPNQMAAHKPHEEPLENKAPIASAKSAAPKGEEIGAFNGAATARGDQAGPNRKSGHSPNSDVAADSGPNAEGREMLDKDAKAIGGAAPVPGESGAGVPGGAAGGARSAGPSHGKVGTAPNDLAEGSLKKSGDGRMDDESGQRRGARGEAAPENGPTDKLAEKRNDPLPARGGERGLIVADCGAAQKMAASQFQSLLAKRGIALIAPANTDDIDPANKRDAAAPSAPAQNPAKPSATMRKGAVSNARPAAPVSPAPAGRSTFGSTALPPANDGGMQARPSPGLAPSATPSPQTEIVYVEADRKTVEQLIDDLRAQPGMFGSVAISAAPASDGDSRNAWAAPEVTRSLAAAEKDGANTIKSLRERTAPGAPVSRDAQRSAIAAKRDEAAVNEPNGFAVRVLGIAPQTEKEKETFARPSRSENQPRAATPPDGKQLEQSPGERNGTATGSGQPAAAESPKETNRPKEQAKLEAKPKGDKAADADKPGEGKSDASKSNAAPNSTLPDSAPPDSAPSGGKFENSNGAKNRSQSASERVRAVFVFRSAAGASSPVEAPPPAKAAK